MGVRAAAAHRARRRTPLRFAVAGAGKQRGVALLFALVLFALIGVSIVISVASGSDPQIERDRVTERALAVAKAALIGYAVDVELTAGNRLGGLPCPDVDNDGSADALPNCGDASGSNPEKRIGRLPWKTLGLPDLRDGDGERLWYVVSNNFKNQEPTTCSIPTDPNCINSDSRGTISVYSPSGRSLNNGAAIGPYDKSGAIAVIIAPGRSLTRLGGTAQNRNPLAIDLSDPQKQPVNYLDAAGFNCGGTTPPIDNAVNRECFVNGPIVDIVGNVVVNDRVLPLTYHDLIPQLEHRVVREVSKCLDLYATANGNRYPWGADTGASAIAAESLPASFADQSGVRAGRIPDTLDATNATSGTMAATWPAPPACKLGWSNWWRNWKLYVFYAVADSYKPASSGSPACAGPGSCLTVSLPSTPATDVKYVIVTAGRSLPLGGSCGLPYPPPAPCQWRGELGHRSDPVNYLEGENVWTVLDPERFALTRPTAIFNDSGVYK